MRCRHGLGNLQTGAGAAAAAPDCSMRQLRWGSAGLRTRPLCRSSGRSAAPPARQDCSRQSAAT